MNIKEFLENKGYVFWKEDRENEGSYRSQSMKFQKRINNPDIPVCECNEKLFINVGYHLFDIGSGVNETCTISICAENESSDWCDLNIYSISVDKFKQNINYYENSLITMWEVFYDGA